MDASHGPPDAEWFRQMANGSAVVFFILRVQPDLAFEFLTEAVESQIGCPAAEGRGKGASPVINELLCAGCGMCQQLCKFAAIAAVEET